MMAQKIQKSTLQSRNDSQFNAITNQRARKSLKLISRGYEELRSQANEYAANMNNTGMTSYSPYYEWNDQLEGFFKRGGRDISQDAPIRQLRENPNLFFAEYAKGNYKDYFEQNPEAQDVVNEYINQEYVPIQNRSIQQKTAYLQHQGRVFRRFSGKEAKIGYSDVDSLLNQAIAAGQAQSQQLSSIKDEERQFVDAENAKYAKYRQDYENVDF